MFIKRWGWKLSNWEIIGPVEQLPASVKVLAIICRHNLLGMPSIMRGFFDRITVREGRDRCRG